MSNKKDLFELFRENEHKLNERPSSDAWRRLESRLDERKESSQTNFLRQLMSIAAVLVLLIAVGVAFSLQEFDKPNPTASAEIPTILEDLSLYEGELDEPSKVLEFTRKHVSRLANPVEEGTADKKLMPKVD